MQLYDFFCPQCQKPFERVVPNKDVSQAQCTTCMTLGKKIVQQSVGFRKDLTDQYNKGL